MSETLRDGPRGPFWMIPIALLRTEWPPNPDLTPGGSERFDAVYDSLRRGEPMREPIKVRSDNWTVIDGCHRLQSARLLGIEYVPVRFWTGTEWLPRVAALATPSVPAGRECDDCNGEGWTAYTTADLMPSGEPGEPYQVQQTCDTCGGRDLETQLVLRAGHLPTCGDGAEFPWDCTCDYAGFMDRIVAALRPTQEEVR